MAPLIVLHWEAFYPFEQIRNALAALKLPEGFPKSHIYAALPASYLAEAVASLESTEFVFGASDMLSSSPDTFTSSIAGKFLEEAKARFVLIGTTFKRHQQKESFASLSHKIQKILQTKVQAFLCFGESQEPLEEGPAAEAIGKMLAETLSLCTPEELVQLIFIYDPPAWATLGGRVQKKDLDRVYHKCFQQYEKLYGNEIARRLKTLCALNPYVPLDKELIQDSSFSGFYFKMTDTNLSVIEAFLKKATPLLKPLEKLEAVQANSEAAVVQADKPAEAKLPESTEKTLEEETPKQEEILDKRPSEDQLSS